MWERTVASDTKVDAAISSAESPCMRSRRTSASRAVRRVNGSKPQLLVVTVRVERASAGRCARTGPSARRRRRCGAAVRPARRRRVASRPSATAPASTHAPHDGAVGLPGDDDDIDAGGREPRDQRDRQAERTEVEVEQDHLRIDGDDIGDDAVVVGDRDDVRVDAVRPATRTRRSGRGARGRRPALPGPRPARACRVVVVGISETVIGRSSTRYRQGDATRCSQRRGRGRGGRSTTP